MKVNKGAKSLSILEPVEYTKNDGSTGIAYNVKKVFDVAQTSGKKPAAPTLDRDPRKLVAIMLDTAPIDVSTVEELPSPNMGAFYKNEDQTLYIKRDIGNSVALCQCVAQELGHAQLAMNCEAYSRRDMGFSAVCVGYRNNTRSPATACLRAFSTAIIVFPVPAAPLTAAVSCSSRKSKIPACSSKRR